MQFDGMLSDNKLIGNLLVGKASADEPEHLSLAFGKALEYLCPLFLIDAVTALGAAFVAGKIKSERVGAVDNRCCRLRLLVRVCGRQSADNTWGLRLKKASTGWER